MSTPTIAAPAPPPDGEGKFAYRIPEVAHLTSISRSALYEDIRTNRLRSFKKGRTRLVSASAIHEYMARLESGDE